MTGYRLISSAISGGGIGIPADQLCVHLDQLLSGKPYAYDLEAEVDGVGLREGRRDARMLEPYVLTAAVRPVVNCCSRDRLGNAEEQQQG